MNVRVIRLAQGFVRTAENDLAVAHHQDFTVNQAQLFAFLLKDDLPGFIDHSVFRSQVIKIVHLMRDEVRLVLGAVVPAPTRVKEAEKLLTGRKLTTGILAEAADAVAAAIEPIDDFRASANYRRDATRVITRRLLERACE